MTRVLRNIIPCALALSLVMSGDAANEPASDDRLERLERALQQLEQRNAELEEKVRRLAGKASRRPAAVVQKAEPPRESTKQDQASTNAPATDQPKPAVFAAASASEFKLKLGGFIQTQVEVGNVSAFEGRFPIEGFDFLGVGEVKDRFRVRRSRINVTGDYAEMFEFKLEGEFQLTAASNFVRTSFAGTDLFINWHAYPQVNVKFGQFKAPFGREQLTSDSKLLSIETSLVTTALAPDRQIGVMAWGKPFASLWPDHADVVTYYAGMFNGTGRNVSTNDNSEFMYVGRLEVTPLKRRLLDQEVRLSFGASGLTSRDDAGLSVSGSLFVNPDGSLASFSLPTAGGREAYGLDAALSIGGFELIGEYLNERVYSREVAGFVPLWRNFRPHGYYVQASYFLIPEKLQLVTKWESFDPDQVRDDEIRTLTGGLNYYIRGDDIKVLANYLHTWSRFRETNAGFGPAEFDEVIVRLQVMF